MNWTVLPNKKTGEFLQYGRIDHSEKLKKAEANKSTMESTKFKEACSRAGVEPTKRQASKWNNKKGKAYSRRNF